MAGDGGFFALSTLERNARGPFLQRIFSGELGAVLVPGALALPLCEAWVARLEAGALPAEPTRFAAEFEAFSIGPCLDQSEGDLAGYLDRIGPFDAALRGQLDVPADELVLSALAPLCEGWPVVRPRAAGGRPYGLVTLRRLPPGGRIPPHCENEQLPRASYRDLRPRIDPAALVSFYFTLRRADDGGALALHDVGVERIGERVRHGHSDMADEVERAARFVLTPPTGSLVIFDGGRRFHQVLPVLGERSRWTLGGFLAPSADRRELFVWA